MIDESIGKILGMAMAYGVSALGLFLAYANYRKRTLKADKVMTPAAWGVVVAVLATIAAGVLVVGELAKRQDATAVAAQEIAQEMEPEPEVLATEELAVMDFESETPAAVASQADGETSRWPLVGILLPAVIFLFATWITAVLYRHFSVTGPATLPSPETPGTSGDAA